MIAPALLRRVRLQMLMARQLRNWREVWSSYIGGSPVPVLRFRNGGLLHGGSRDSPAFLFLEVFANGCYRRMLPRTISGVAIDIGANIGAFTLDMAWRHPSLTMHAYEPDPETCDQLRENIAANGLAGRVRIWNEAIAGTAGTLRLWRSDGSIAASAYAVETARGTAVDVPAVTLATAIERAGGRITLLKMDCEGAEAEILEAGGPVLDALDWIVAEYHTALVPDVIPRIRRALDAGFTVTVAEGDRRGPLFSARRRGARSRR
jgi:FkbM family methyltransferase